MLSSLRAAAAKCVEKLASHVAGAVDDGPPDSSRLEYEKDLDTDVFELPAGTPIVSFSRRAIEMIGTSRKTSTKSSQLERSSGPRPGSLEWRRQQQGRV